MIEEHDKEIDALLRRLARSEQASAATAGGHVDPDEISVFAENALPEKARARVISHLADCGRCRTILSNVVALRAQESPLSEAEQAGAAISVSIPWYKKLFAVRNLATALGALLVLFAGFFAVFLIRNLGGPSDSVARVENANYAPAAEADQMAEAPNEPRNEGESAPPNDPSANTVAEPAATPVASGPGNNESARDENAKRRQIPVDVVGRLDDRVVEKKGGAGAGTGNRSALKVSPRISSATQPAMAPPPAPPPPPVEQRPVAESIEMTEVERARDKDDARVANLAAGAAAAKEERVLTRRVGGKSFTQKDKVWYDSAYSGQTTTNVKRNTAAFRSLDNGLRSIANSLTGTVVVVWNSKAYRID